MAGTDQDVSARRVADELAVQLEAQLADAGDVLLPDSLDVAAAIVDIVPYLPDESPDELAGLLAPFWSGAKVRRELGGATRQALDARRRRSTLPALRTSDGDLVYPVSQFHRRAGGIEVKPGLLPVLSTLGRTTRGRWRCCCTRRRPSSAG